MFRRMALLVALVFTVVGLSACGQTTPPTKEDVLEDGEWFTTTRPDGVEMYCLVYSSGTRGLSDSKSWFSFSCSPADLSTPSPDAGNPNSEDGSNDGIVVN